jgi:hypothetical protein
MGYPLMTQGEFHKKRRSARLAMSVPIRVYAIDFKGIDFVEETSTVVVNHHGAKIRLTHQLLPEQEIRIQSLQTDQEAVFRVVNRAGRSEDRFTFWGVESLEPTNNIWGVGFPRPAAADQRLVRSTMRCPVCHWSETLYLDEPLVESVQELGGLLRGCLHCGLTGVWKPVPYSDS